MRDSGNSVLSARLDDDDDDLGEIQWVKKLLVTTEKKMILFHNLFSFL